MMKQKLLEISTLQSSKRCKLNQAPVHKLNEERSAGWVNHEINIRGKKHLELVSRITVINKSVDLLHKADLTELKKYIKPAAEIKQVKIQRAEKIKQHSEKGYTVKEAANLKADSIKFKFTGITKTRKSIRSIYFC